MKKRKLLTAMLALWFGLPSFAEVYEGTCGENVRYSLDTETGVLALTGEGIISYSTIYNDPLWNAHKKRIKQIKADDGIKFPTYDWLSGCDSIVEPQYNKTTFIYMPRKYKADVWSSYNYGIPMGIKTVAPYAFSSCKGLMRVTMNGGCEEVGNNAFSNCQDLQVVSFPGTIKRIGNNAFYNCKNLESINMPDGVESVGANCFRYCNALTEGVYNEDCFFYLSEEVTGDFTIPGSPKKIAPNAFAYGKITTLKIPESVKEIGKMAFYYNTGLQRVEMPSRLDVLGDNAFSGCQALEEVVIPEGVHKISDYMFGGSSALKKVTLPETLDSIGHYAFQYCPALEEIQLPAGLKFIGSSAFLDCTALKKVNIPESLSIVDNPIFQGCTSLAEPLYNSTFFVYLPPVYEGEYTVPDGIKAVAGGAFASCNLLTAVNLPASVEKLGYLVFGQCTSLEHVNLPEGITSLLNYTFKGCTQLVEVNLSDGLQYLGYDAFEGCVSLTRLDFPAGLDEIASSVFEGCTNMAYVGVAIGNPNYSSYKGLLCNKEQTEIIYLPPAMEEMFLPETLEEMPSYYTWKTCTRLRALALPISGPSWSAVDEKGILGCIFDAGGYLGRFTEEDETGKMWSVDRHESRLPETLKKLTLYCDTLYMPQLVFTKVTGVSTKTEYATGGLDQLDTLIVLASTDIDTKVLKLFQNVKHIELSKVKVMEEGCMAGLKKLESLKLPYAGVGSITTARNFGALFSTVADEEMTRVTQKLEDGTSQTYYLPSGLQSLELAEGCETLPYGTFSGCHLLKTVTLPSTLYMVAEETFYGCAGLTDIYCKGASPASAFSNSFDGVRVATCKLHVPHGAGEMYKRSTGWKDFYYIEEEAPITVAVAKNIENAGVIYGMNEYQLGETAELKAVAHSGYVFSAWTEDGQVVSEEETYSFVVEGSRSLIAVFVPVSGSNSVETEAGSTSVAFTWEAEEGASCYQLNVYRDEAMTQLAGSLWFDAEGNPVKKRSTMLSATIDGLEASTGYYYRMTAYNEADQAISQYTGTFETTDADAISETLQDDVVSVRARSGGIVVEGAVGKVVTVFTLSGKMAVQKKAENQTEEITLERGFYIVKVGNGSYKTVVK